MKRWIAFVIVVAFAFNLAGCDAVQRKFTRKKKEVKAPRIYQLKKYDIKPSPELYEKHFSYWQSWSSEILQRLGDNHKKDVRCINELISQLQDMKNILVPEKADALQKYAGQYDRVRNTIERQELSQYNKSDSMMTLERLDRTVKREFCLDRIRNYIKQSFDSDEEAAAAAQSAPAPAQAPQPDAAEKVPADRVAKSDEK